MRKYILKVVAFMAIVSFISLFPKVSIAQNSKPNNEGFLLKNGNDTLTIERYTRDDNSIAGLLMLRKQVPVSYQALLNNQSQLSRLIIEVLQPGMPEGVAPKQKTVMTFKADSIISENSASDTMRREAVKTTAGAMAYHGSVPMIGMLEQIIIRARSIGGKQVTVPVFLLSSKGQTANAMVDFSANDSAILKLGNIEAHLQVNAKGYILGGKTTSGQTITRLTNVPDAAFAPRPPDYSAPASAPYTAEEVRIHTKAGHTLMGTLTLPKNVKGKSPVVVTITGSSPQDRDNNTPYNGPYKIFREIADELGKKDIAVLRMDDRGIGQSTGNFDEATTADRADDIREGIKYIKNHPLVDKDNIVLIGLSEGGVIAPLIAQTEKGLSGIVLLAGPASTGEEIMQYQLKYQVSQIKNATQEQKDKSYNEAMGASKKLSETKPWVRYFLTYDPIKVAQKVENVPVLILQGTNDKNVPPSDAAKLEQAFKRAGNKNVTMKMFDNVNHIFVHDTDGNPKNYQNLKSFSIAPEVLETIVGWVQKHTARKL